jgi:hypothetical protein
MPLSPPMTASIRDILAAFAFGTIVYRLTNGKADAHGSDGHPINEHISPLERLYRLRLLRV